MTIKAKLSGVLAPILTPFTKDGAVDHTRYITHARWLLDNGCAGLVPFGTTGEASSISPGERMEALDALVAAGIAPGQLLPGTGLCSLAETIELTRHATKLGCHGVLTLPPFYYKAVSDDGLYAYFAQLIEQVADDRLRLYLYHIPPIAGVGFSLDLVARLAHNFPDFVVGIKDSSGDWINTAALLKHLPDFEIYPGSEVFLLDGLRQGALGCITATANINSRAISAVFEAYDSENANMLQADITKIRNIIQKFPMVPALKFLLAHYHDDPDWGEPCAPLLALSEVDGAALLDAVHGFVLSISNGSE